MQSWKRERERERHTLACASCADVILLGQAQRNLLCFGMFPWQQGLPLQERFNWLVHLLEIDLGWVSAAMIKQKRHTLLIHDNLILCKVLKVLITQYKELVNMSMFEECLLPRRLWNAVHWFFNNFVLPIQKAFNIKWRCSKCPNACAELGPDVTGEIHQG